MNSGSRLFIFVILFASNGGIAYAHHVLGRPSYSLNEDSNTPSSLQVEMSIGGYFVNYMVYPAFPKAGEPGRINFYATHDRTRQALDSEVKFTVSDDGLFGRSNTESLGVQIIDDNVYRQGFQFSDDGAYIITASFAAEGETHHIDFPLRIGEPPRFGPVGIAITLVAFALAGVTLIRRKRILLDKVQHSRDQADTER